MTEPETNKILFEHPLNERCRTLLRLSRLFNQFEKNMAGGDHWSSRTALQALLEISSILARSDLKSELIKELERHATILSAMINNPKVDTVRLQQILDDINTLSNTLKQYSSQLGHAIRTDDYLNSIAQRLSIPGGSFDFDLPQLHYWLHLPHSERVLQLDSWRHEVSVVQATVDLLLTLIRNSTTYKDSAAGAGFYQQNLDSKRTIQMIQVQVDQELGTYPEISGSKHRFSIRFMEMNDWSHPEQSAKDIPFRLKICVI